jgi:hypothetical protein
MAEAAVAILRAPQPVRQSSVQAAASKPRFPLNREAIAQYSAATASRLKRAAPAAALVVDVDVAATIAAAVVAEADVTSFSTYQSSRESRHAISVPAFLFHLGILCLLSFHTCSRNHAGIYCGIYQ